MFGIFKRKQKNKEILEKIVQQDKTLLENTHETIMIAQDVIKALEAKLDDYVNQVSKISLLIKDSLIMTDANGLIESINPFAEKMFGYSSNELIGKSLSELFDIDPRNFMIDLLYLHNNKKYFHEKFMGVKKNGELIYIDLTLSEVLKSDNTKYYIIIIKDVSERIDFINKIKESEQHLDAFSDATTEGMLIHNDDEILDYNTVLSNITDYTVNELDVIDPYILFEKKDLEKINLNEMFESSKFHTNIKTKFGELIPVEITNKNVKWNSEPAKIKIITDITEYKITEEQIKEARERYKSIIDNNIDVLCCYGTDFIITFVNQTFLEYFNIEIEDVIGHKMCEFFCDEDHQLIRDNVSDIMDGTEFKRSLFKVECDGELRFNDWIDKGIFDDDGNLIEIQSVSRDVTAYIKKAGN